MSLTSFDILKFYAQQQKYDQMDISNFHKEEIILDNNETTYNYDLTYNNKGNPITKKLKLKLVDSNKTQLDKEVQIMENLAKFKMPVPYIEDFGENQKIFGANFIITERFNGKPLGQVIDQFYLKGEISDVIILQLTQMHEALKIMKFTKDNLFELPPKEDTYKIYLKEKLDKMFTDFPEGVEEDVQNLKQFAKSRIDDLETKDPVLIHGDLHLNNIILKGEEELVFTQWNNSRYDDPRVEIANSFVSNLLMINNDIANALYQQLNDALGYEQSQVEIFVINRILQILDKYLQNKSLGKDDQSEYHTDHSEIDHIDSIILYLEEISGLELSIKKHI